MKTTDEIIKECFKKAHMWRDEDRAKYLYRILSDAMKEYVEKFKKRPAEEVLSDLVCNDSCAIETPSGSIIQSASMCYEYNGSKDYVVTDRVGRLRAFNTVTGALNSKD